MKTLKLLAVVTVAVLFLGACSNKEESEVVAQKIEKSEPLTEQDYATMIKYMGRFAEQAQPIQNEINNMEAGNPKAAELTAKIDSMRMSLPYLEIFTTRLHSATEAELGPDNVALVNKYAGYEWFTSPDWAIVSEDPGVAGMVLQSPASDTDTAVVAGAVDVETVHSL